jgi:hypothetical protein
MKTISLRIEDELKKEMEKLKWINWSEIIRGIIKKKIEEEEKKKVGYAVKVHMDILSKVKRSEIDSSEIIRKFREIR